MRRREFIAGLGGAAVWPLVARGQQPVMPLIGFLGARSADDSMHLLAAFRRGLSETDYVEGQNVAIEYRWAEGRYDRLPALASDLVGRQVTAIIAVGGFVAARAAKAATVTIPIVFLTGGDPVQLGLVTNLSQPDGNLTGLTILGSTLVPKQLELLHEMAPTAAVVAFLVNPDDPLAEFETKPLQAAARTTGQQILVLNARTDGDLDEAFTTLVRRQAGGLVVEPDPFFNSRSDQIIALAARHAVPAVYGLREFAAAGGLMSYGNSLSDAYRQLGIYTGRILKGARPTDLPVQQSVKVELVINIKTAKALGLTIPLGLVGRADEVIE
jgi:putative ABC transport system substrate-binding protein